MTRPCQLVHPLLDGLHCRYCFLGRHDERYRKLWGIPGLPESVPDDSPFQLPTQRPQCRHAGDPLPPAKAARLNLGTVRTYFPCAKGHGTAGHVCACHQFPRGCKGCPDRAAVAGSPAD